MDNETRMAQMAVELNDQTTMQSTGDLVTELAREITSADEAGLMLVHARHRIETVSATAPVVVQAHDLQVSLDEGPCLDAIDASEAFVVNDTAHDDQWPAWSAAVVELGIGSAMGIRLESKRRGYGSLNLYAHRADAFREQDVELAKNFGMHASIALASAHTEDNLMASLVGRSVIGQAQGVVMSRFDIGAEQAFDYLRRRSQSENVKLGEVVADVIREAAGPHPD